MNKLDRKTMIITTVITLLPLVIGVILWNRLPDEMATHFGFDNQANGFSSKPFTVFGIPAFMCMLQWIVALVTRADPRYRNISSKLMKMCLWIIPITSLIVAVVIYPYNMGLEFDISFFMELFMGCLFLILGNYLPKMRQNYTMGIKLPWTLADEDNWNRTHRLGGYVWTIGGLLIIIVTLIGLEQLSIMTGIIIAMVVIPSIYSFWLYIKKNE